MATGVEPTHVLDGVKVRSGLALQAANGTLTYVDGDGNGRLLVGGSLVNAGAPYAPEASIIQPYPAEDAWTTTTLATTNFYGTVFTASQTVTVGGFVALMTNSMSGGSLFRLGLYTVAADNSMVLVARNGGSIADGASAGWITPAFNTTGGYPGSYQVVAGSVYCVGVCQVAGTSPAFRSKSYATAPPSSPLLTLYKRSVIVAAASECPTTISSSASRDPNVLWIGLV